MAKILVGLNSDFANALELQKHYIELDDVVHIATKVE